ncbi:hypothetical protein TNIN_292541 [Trichonephila inaurata madagascariensis]|uniref:Uncharacterized protein n=1 Tax=Trichonephila inaurata madagascariensis TaxID=2747483 RepID=A0A8X7BUD1_9ARAC|nr:hypothetical protein TNIN_292541 [Trichonephila inaurata madagascariensis]
MADELSPACMNSEFTSRPLKPASLVPPTFHVHSPFRTLTGDKGNTTLRAQYNQYGTSSVPKMSSVVVVLLPTS